MLIELKTQFYNLHSIIQFFLNRNTYIISISENQGLSERALSP